MTLVLTMWRILSYYKEFQQHRKFSKFSKYSMTLEMSICGEEGKKVESTVMGGAVIGPKNYYK